MGGCRAGSWPLGALPTAHPQHLSRGCSRAAASLLPGCCPRSEALDPRGDSRPSLLSHHTHPVGPCSGRAHRPVTAHRTLGPPGGAGGAPDAYTHTWRGRGQVSWLLGWPRSFPQTEKNDNRAREQNGRICSRCCGRKTGSSLALGQLCPSPMDTLQLPLLPAQLHQDAPPPPPRDANDPATATSGCGDHGRTPYVSSPRPDPGWIFRGPLPRGPLLTTPENMVSKVLGVTIDTASKEPE